MVCFSWGVRGRCGMLCAVPMAYCCPILPCSFQGGSGGKFTFADWGVRRTDKGVDDNYHAHFPSPMMSLHYCIHSPNTFHKWNAELYRLFC